MNNDVLNNESEIITGKIYNVQRFCIHDGQGIRTVVFFKGCSLSCRWCANPESQNMFDEVGYIKKKCIGCNRCTSVCPSGGITQNEWQDKIIHPDICRECINKPCIKACPAHALIKYGRNVTIEQLEKEVERDELFYRISGGGVTASGGDPLLQSKFLSYFFQKCKQRGYHTAVETASAVPWNQIEAVVRFTDSFLCDVKTLNEEKFSEFTGGDLKLVIRNLNNLTAIHENIVIRVPVIPGLNDKTSEIEKICEFTKNLKIQKIHLLPYHRLGAPKYDYLSRQYKYAGVEPLTHENMQRLKEIAQTYGLDVSVGG